MSENQYISLDTSLLNNFIDTRTIEKLQPQVDKVVKSLRAGSCAGNDFLGWLDLPSEIDQQELADVKKVAAEIRDNAEHLICVGIGGSYLGARATIDFLSSPFSGNKKIIYFGHQLSSDYAHDMFEYILDKNIYINVISKSGTTTEPGVAFRLLLDKLKSRYSAEELKKRIVATTDKSKGALRTLANKKGYRTFVIPDNVGGRFSVLTPVGLLPIAAAGFDIDALLEGAVSMQKLCAEKNSITDNPALLYAAARFALYGKGKTVEVQSAFEPSLQYIGEWWKQLYGESEGKDGKGIFPASTVFTTDLHSMGQYIQDGIRNVFETFLMLDKTKSTVKVPDLAGNPDGMNFLTGMDLSYVNHQAYRGTALAHLAGNVPNMTITIPERTEYYLGQLFYFFEYAVAVSGLLLDINPFNQPGVEAYKQNMFALLGKPGYEDRKQALLKE